MKEMLRFGVGVGGEGRVGRMMWMMWMMWMLGGGVVGGICFSCDRFFCLPPSLPSDYLLYYYHSVAGYLKPCLLVILSLGWWWVFGDGYLHVMVCFAL